MYIEMSQTLLQLVNHRFLNIIYYDHLYVIISIPGQRRVRSASIQYDPQGFPGLVQLDHTLILINP